MVFVLFIQRFLNMKKLKSISKLSRRELREKYANEMCREIRYQFANNIIEEETLFKILSKWMKVAKKDKYIRP